MSKMRLSDLKPQIFEYELEHPEMGKTGAIVKLRSPNCDDYFFKALELNKVDEDAEDGDRVVKVKESMKASAELVAVCIVDWDQEFFECEYNYDNAVKILSTVENFWIRDAINDQLKERENFFPNASKTSKKQSKKQ